MYDMRDVELLYSSVWLHSSRSISFVCLTDEPTAPEGITIVPLEHPEWETKQSKVELFRPDLDLGRVLYIDLDTLVVGSLEDIYSYTGDFCMLADLEGKPQVCRGSGLMAWGSDVDWGIYEAFEALDDTVRQGVYRVGGGRSDQLFIHHHTPVRPHAFQSLWPGQVVGYKSEAGENARVVCYWGRGKPDRCR
jgi:hypothetical protein